MIEPMIWKAAATALMVSLAIPLPAKTPAVYHHHAKRAETKSAPSRTLSQVVKQVLAKRVPHSLNPPTTTHLGYPGSIHTYVLRITYRIAPDHCDHAFEVLPKKKDDATSAGEIVISKTCMTEKDGKRNANGVFFRCTPTGKLLAAASASLEHGSVSEDRMDIDSPSTKRAYDSELHTILKTGSSPKRVGDFRLISDRIEHAGEDLERQVLLVA